MPDQSRIEIYGHLLDRLVEPLLLCTREGRIARANVAGVDALGTSVAALRDESLASYSLDPTRVTALLDSARAGAPPVVFPLRARNGRRFFCDATELEPSILLLRLSGGPDPEARLRALFGSLSRFEDVAATSSASTVAEAARVLLGEGVGPLGAIAGGVFLLDETAANLELVASVGYPADVADRFRMVQIVAQMPLTDAFRRRTPVFLGTVGEFHSAYPEFARTHETITRRGMACIPLELAGAMIGVLGFGFPLDWTFSPEARRQLQGFAERCAQVIDRARLADAERLSRRRADHSAAQLSRLHSFTSALAQATGWAQVVEAVVDMGMAVTGARSGGLWILEEDGASVTLTRNVGPTGPTAEKFAGVPLAGPMRMPILDAILHRAPIWIESCGQLEELYPAVARMFSQGGESSLACLPLLAQGRCIGGLVFNFEGIRRWVADERAFLQLLSWYSAQAVERARLYGLEVRAREVAQSNQRRSDFLANSATIVASSLDLGSTLTSLARAAVPGVADWCIVELADGDVPPVAAHVDPSKVDFVLGLSRRHRQLGRESGIPRAIRTGESQLFRHVSAEDLRRGVGADPALEELYRGTGLVSAMVVPVAARGRTLGAILLVSASVDRLYDDEDLAMAQELGRRAGIAVDNAHLYREARAADRRKDEFMAMLGHELRNPLSPILTALELMDLTGGDAFGRDRAVIARQVKHMVRLVDDLLDVSRITSGKIRLRKAPVEVARVIVGAVEMAGPILEERSQRLTVSEPESSRQIVVDQHRLSQAVANLLINAARYTEPNGEIGLEARIGASELEIRVRDTGMGIAPEMLPRIFDLFVQEKSSLDRPQGGLGIGLAVVKSLVELHGGEVSAQSAGLGKGSEFVIRVPLGAEEMEPIAVDDASPVAVRPAEPRRALIVEDNADIGQTLADAMEALGCVTLVAHDGPSALAAVATFAPELALLDIGLPVMDGYELARRIRSLARGGPVGGLARGPAWLVALTGYGQASDVQRAKEAGFDEHIVKPVTLARLRELLARLEKVSPRR